MSNCADKNHTTTLRFPKEERWQLVLVAVLIWYGRLLDFEKAFSS